MNESDRSRWPWKGVKGNIPTPVRKVNQKPYDLPWNSRNSWFPWKYGTSYQPKQPKGGTKQGKVPPRVGSDKDIFWRTSGVKSSRSPERGSDIASYLQSEESPAAPSLAQQSDQRFVTIVGARGQRDTLKSWLEMSKEEECCHRFIAVCLSSPFLSSSCPLWFFVFRVPPPIRGFSTKKQTTVVGLVFPFYFRIILKRRKMKAD